MTESLALPLDPSKPGYYHEAGFATIETARETLDKLGFAVIPSLLSGVEVEGVRAHIWAELKGLCADMDVPFDPDRPETFSTPAKNLYPHQGMLFQHYINHIQGLWRLRENPQVYEAFQRLYNTTQQMLVSFDGMSVLPSQNTGMSDLRKPVLPFHTDQALTRPDFECIQGFVTLYPVNAGDATLAVMSGSHTMHEAFRQRFYPEPLEKKERDKIRQDWVQVKTAEQQQWYRDRGCTEVYIQCPEGSLVLWDSRTVHCGRLRDAQRLTTSPRMVAYVCMTPKDRCAPKKIVARRKAFEGLRGTTHWPEKAKLFGRHPRTYGRPLPKVRMPAPPSLTAHGRRLVGYDK